MGYTAAMQDEFDGVRLPDLPTDGYESPRAKELTDAIMFFIRGMERDRLALLDIVISGPQKFRRVAGHAWRYLSMPDSLCDAVFGYLKLLATPSEGVVGEPGDPLPRDQQERLEREREALQRLNSPEERIERVWQLSGIERRG